jgi:hypothetical protein
MLLMVQMTSIAATSRAASSKMRIAVELGESVIEHFRNTPWNSIRSSPLEGFVEANGVFAPATFNLPMAAGDSVTVLGTVYYRIWRVVPDREIPNLKTITVWCCWKGEGDAWRHTALVTQLTDVNYQPK